MSDRKVQSVINRVYNQFLWLKMATFYEFKNLLFKANLRLTCALIIFGFSILLPLVPLKKDMVEFLIPLHCFFPLLFGGATTLGLFWLSLKRTDSLSGKILNLNEGILNRSITFLSYSVVLSSSGILLSSTVFLIAAELASAMAVRVKRKQEILQTRMRLQTLSTS